MKLRIFQVDAFSDHVFGGNPAAVVLLDAWLNDPTLLALAEENNLSETAFLVPAEDNHHYQLRWFTPADEVKLCGHATMAAAHVLFNHAGFNADELRFTTRSGTLSVTRGDNNLLRMDFPAAQLQPVEEIPQALLEGLGGKPSRVLKSYDYVAVFESEDAVSALEPDFAALSELDGRGVLATAPGNGVDFVSRCFFPKLRVNEDPVTGSAHCELVPLWAGALNKTQFKATQLSARKGQLYCQLAGDRVILEGQAITFMEGHISVPD